MVRMLVVSGVLAIAPAMAEPHPHRLDEMARARMATDGVPGLVIVLIAGGEPVWTGAFGLAAASVVVTGLATGAPALQIHERLASS